jgi:sugar transferase (PEP-CTERM system associated)
MTWPTPRSGRIIQSREDLGYVLTGYLDSRAERVGSPFVEPGIVGIYDDVSAIVKEQRVDEIIVALSNRRGTMPVQDLLDLKFRGVRITDGMNFYEREFNRVYVRQLTPSWMIFSDGFIVTPLTRLAKRTMDVGLSATALVLVAPVMLVTGILIRLTSKGPALYSQVRVGRWGAPFTMWKFRSMRTDAEAAGPQFAKKKDPRITGIGRFIRKTRIDELPQLINILRGQMSLVGPRPERPVFVKQLEEKIPFYGQRHQVKPGLTGLAQISYGYSEGEEDHLHKLQYDLCYIKNLSVTLDLAIMAKTLKVVVLGTGAR